MSIEKSLERYSNSAYIRAVVTAIPYIGSALDILLYEKGSKWRQERFNQMIEALSNEIEELGIASDEIIESLNAKIDSEEFYDLFIQASQNATKEKSEEKIATISHILAGYSSGEINEVDEASLLLDLVSEISAYSCKWLSKLSQNQIPDYYKIKGKYVVWEDYEKFLISNYLDIRKEKSIPPEYTISDLQIYSFQRLEDLHLIRKTEINTYSGGKISYILKRPSQSSTIHFTYEEKISYQIDSLGHLFIEWIKDQF